RAILPDGPSDIAAFTEPVVTSGAARFPGTCVEVRVLIRAEEATVESVAAALQRSVNEAAGRVTLRSVVSGGVHLVLVDEFARRCICRKADAVVGSTIQPVLDGIESGAVDGDVRGRRIVRVDVWVDAGDG